MKAMVAVALLMMPAPALAVAGSEDQSASSRSERRHCTRVEVTSGSRMSHRRVCLTAAEWRERLGPDWRQRLAGRDSPEEDMDSVDNRARVFSDQPVPSGERPR